MAEAQDQGAATDQVTTTLTKGPAAPAQGQTATSQTLPLAGAAATPGTPVSKLSGPEHAVAVLKEKVGLLHTLANNVVRFDHVLVSDAEALLADIKYVLSFGHSASAKK